MTPAPTLRRTMPALLSTQLASTVGSSMSGFALALWLFGETGSATWLGLLLLGNTLPGILLGPWAGALADRWPRRLAMLLADGLGASATLVAVALIATERLEPWHLLGVTAVLSTSAAIQEPAFGAALTTLADRDRLTRLNGVLQLGPAIGLAIGPAIAGVLLATGGLGLALGVDLATFVVAAVTLALLRFPADPGRAAAAADRPRLRAGWRVLRDDRGLFAIIMTAAAVNMLLGYVSVLTIPVVLGLGGEVAAGAVLGVTGAGMVVGSLAVAALGDRDRPATVIGLSLATLGIGTVLAGLRPNLLVVAAGVLVLAIAVPFASAAARALVQRTVPDDLLGRVLGLQRTLATAAIPVAHVTAGPLADRVFEPALAPGGRLAATVGTVIGTGGGRGAAAMFVLAGIGVVLLGLRLLRHPGIRDLERRATAGDDRDGQPAAAAPAP